MDTELKIVFSSDVKLSILSRDKIYTAINISKYYILIECDDGHERHFSINYFITLAEYRRRNINLILYG